MNVGPRRGSAGSGGGEPGVRALLQDADRRRYHLGRQRSRLGRNHQHDKSAVSVGRRCVGDSRHHMAGRRVHERRGRQRPKGLDHGDGHRDDVCDGHAGHCRRREQDIRPGRVPDRRAVPPPTSARCMLRARLTDSTTITIDRSTVGPPTVAISEINWQAIELTDKSVVVGGSSSFAAGVGHGQRPDGPARRTSHGRSPSARSRAAAGRTWAALPYVGEDILGVGAATMALSATQLTLTRNNTAAAADFGWFVVEFEQADEHRSCPGPIPAMARRARHRRGLPSRFRHRQGRRPNRQNADVAVFRSTTMGGANSKPAVGAVGLAANMIISIDATGAGGFTVGSHARVNSNAARVDAWTTGPRSEPVPGRWQWARTSVPAPRYPSRRSPVWASRPNWSSSCRERTRPSSTRQSRRT